MQRHLAKWMLILCAISAVGCSGTQQARVRIIEPSFSYVDDRVTTTKTNKSETLAHVPITGSSQP